MGFTLHGEASAASGSIAFLLYDPEGNVHSLKPTQHVEIHSLTIGTDAAALVGIFCITDTAGKRVIKTNTTTTRLSITHTFGSPYICPRGVTPVLISDDATGNHSVITGFVRDA